jgi:hypothetical protein
MGSAGCGSPTQANAGAFRGRFAVVDTRVPAGDSLRRRQKLRAVFNVSGLIRIHCQRCAQPGASPRYRSAVSNTQVTTFP